MFVHWAQLPIPRPLREGPPVIPRDNGEPAVDVTGMHARILYLASYRTQGIASSPARLYLRASAARRLCQAADMLEADMQLAVFDGLRPQSVQQALFDEYRARLSAAHPDWPPDRLWAETCRFVASPVVNPERPSNHLTGGAVDLTLYRDGQPLPMGTEFDDFSDRAGTRYFERADISPEEAVFRDNRRMLYHLMVAQGFTNYPEEWWHFDFGNPNWARRTGREAIYGYCPVPAE